MTYVQKLLIVLVLVLRLGEFFVCSFSVQKLVGTLSDGVSLRFYNCKLFCDLHFAVQVLCIRLLLLIQIPLNTTFASIGFNYSFDTSLAQV